MRIRLVAALVVLLASFPAVGLAQVATPDCAALITTHGDVRVLTVAGSFERRGYLQGYCLAEGVLAVMDDFALKGLPPILFRALKAGLRARMELPEGMLEEAAGLVAGARDRLGDGFESRHLGRVPDVDDILVVNAYVDFMASGCSSLSAWARATRGGGLAGAAALARNMDWSTHPVLLAHQLVIVHRPGSPDREQFLSVTFPGLLGCLSCVDAGGTGAFLNLGYGPQRGSLLETQRFQPVSMTLRDAIERRDPDGDGLATARDIVAVFKGVPTVGAYGIHAVAAAAAPDAGSALVLELNSAGIAVRVDSRSTEFGADTLGLTNHLQILDEPTRCRRYRRLAGISARRDLDARALWDAMRAVIMEGSTLQTMLYVPSANRLRLWLRPSGHEGPPAWTDGVDLDLRALFGTSPKTSESTCCGSRSTSAERRIDRSASSLEHDDTRHRLSSQSLSAQASRPPSDGIFACFGTGGTP